MAALSSELNNNRGTFQLHRISSPATLAGNSKLNLMDQTTKAEVLLVIKGIESTWSYSSFNNLGEVYLLSDIL